MTKQRGLDSDDKMEKGRDIAKNDRKHFWKKKSIDSRNLEKRISEIPGGTEENIETFQTNDNKLKNSSLEDITLNVESRKIVYESPDVQIIETIYIDNDGIKSKEYEIVKKEAETDKGSKKNIALSKKEKNIKDIIKKRQEGMELEDKIPPEYSSSYRNNLNFPPRGIDLLDPDIIISTSEDVPFFIPIESFSPPKIVRQDEIKLLENTEREMKQSRDLDFYPLIEPYAFARIYFNPETQQREYIVIEPPLNNFEKEKLESIKNILIRGLDVNLEELEKKGAEQYLKGSINRIIEDYDMLLDPGSKEKIFYYIVRDFLGYGKIDALMRDPNIEDISCDGPAIPIFLYHRKYGSLKTNIVFETEEELSAFVIKLAQKCGKHISIAEPMLDATLPDGSRIQITLSTEVTTKGSTFTIRKFRPDPFTPVDLVKFGTFSAEMAAYMWLCIEHGANALFAGGTASGKTTSLNAFSLFIPPQSKIVSVEETREINLPHPNWIPGLTRTGFGEVVDNRRVGEIDLYDLVKAALRQRPEYLLVGEIRGREAYVLFQAMATGHTTYSTVHADSPQALIHRLEGKPIEIPRVMLQSLDIVLFHTSVKIKGKRARRCKQIVEIIGIDPNTKEILTNEVFRWIPEKDQFDFSGKSYVLERIRGSIGVSKEDIDREFRVRTEIIEWMVYKEVKSYKEFARIISEYYENPKDVIYRMRREMNATYHVSKNKL